MGSELGGPDGRDGMWTRPVGLLSLAMVAVAALGPLSAVPGAQEITYFEVGTGASGDTYFEVGGLLASAISSPPGGLACEEGGSCGVPGMIAVAQATDGSVANLAAISAGTMDSGLAQADVAYWAYNGGGPYEESGELENLSAIASLYRESVHVVVRRGAGIRRISQLRGKRVSLGPTGSGTRIQAEVILGAFGVDVAELDVSYHAAGPASDLLLKRELDAFFVVGGDPINAISSLAENMRIGLIDLAGETVEKLIGRYPFFTRGVIPPDTYKGVLVTPTLNVSAQWIVSAATDEELVYGITRALWHERTRALLDNGHPDARRITLETSLNGLAMPLHPGAARYYREAGLLK